MNRLQILVLEDEKEIRTLYRVLLFDHQIEQVATVEDARAALRYGTFDAFITDWTLPDGCAEQILRELGALGSSMRRIVHSACEPENLDDLEAIGLIHEFFLKPSWFELSRSLARISGGAGNGQGLELRVSPRACVGLTAFVRCESWQALRRLYTDDLSQDGLSLRASEPAPVGAQVVMALLMPDGVRLRLSGEVRHSHPIAGSDGLGSWRIGIRLRNPSTRKRIVLRALLRSRIAAAAQVMVTPPPKAA